MKILQLVTYASKDGAFGGPLAVAVAQCTELARRGHEVELVAGWDGALQLDIPGVRVSLFRTYQVMPGGFSGLASLKLLMHVAAASKAVDVIHVHLGRDIITAVGATASPKAARLVLQTHGMVMPDGRAKSQIFDAVWTKRLFKRASMTLSLTPIEGDGLRRIEPRTIIEQIPNGVPLPSYPATSDSTRTEILFLSRLHPRKRVIEFARAAKLVLAQLPDAVFKIVGPDEGDLELLKSYITENGLATNVIYEGTLAPGQAVDRMRQAAVYVLPSVGEVIPMSLLEAMSVGIPSIITNQNGLAGAVQAAGAGIVTDGSAEELASAMVHLLNARQLRDDMGRAARQVVKTTFSAEAVAERLEAAYRGRN